MRPPTDRPAPLPLLALEPAAAYAEVAVDTGGRGPDGLFTYLVPPPLAGRVVPGCRVRVPFAGRAGGVPGVVFAVGPEPSPGVPAARLRAVQDVDAGPAPLGAPELDLARWLAEEAVCTLAQAVRSLLPPIGGTGRPVRHCFPTAGPHDARALRRAPAQAAAWRAVLAEPGLSVPELARRGCRPAAIAALAERGWIEFGPAPPPTDPFAETAAALATEPPPQPTPAQAAALDALRPALDGPLPERFLLWGVTGSGKTEVYLRAIERVLAHGRQAIVLVPEIALTPQTVASFRRRFGGRVAVLHSALAAGERARQWWRIRRGEVGVVVGARSAVFAPCSRLGLIVVDEEHEPSYKQEEAPRYHAREVALERARRAGAPTLLGTATPDVGTLAAAASGRVRRLDLPERVRGRPLPVVRVLDMRGAAVEGPLGEELRQALLRHVGAGRQALLFLNRRGFAPVLLCGVCGFVARCQSCDVTLCYHEADRRLHCHYCAARRVPPEVCPKCGGHFLRLRGSGTERVAAAVEDLLPGVPVARMDVDSTRTRDAYRRIYEDFRAGRARVLVGTQMVAKGWDVAGVTLVGVIDADTGLHFPDYRGAERTCQLLCQVAGRAGRGEEAGEVLVQTRSPDHPAVQAAARHDYAAFARAELGERRLAGFPPFARLLRLLAWGRRAAEVEATARTLAQACEADLPAGVDVWGPAQAPLGRLRGQYRWHVCLRGPEAPTLRAVARRALDAAPARGRAVRVAADPDPYSML